MSGFDEDKNNNVAPERPRLKKVKRPVKRPLNASENNSTPQKAVVLSSFEDEQDSFVPVSQDAFNLDSYLDEEDKQPNFIKDEDLYANNKSNKFMVGDLFTTYSIILAAIAGLFLGFIFTKTLFSDEKVVRNGLQGVISNSEIPRGRARCGLTERTQGCVLYLMNPQRQELNARDFYDLASQLTGRQRFVIETGNIRYSNVKIKPGEIAQLNIPPL
ncbi:MAG: hypothetical protein PHE89_02370 [Alphaproteobacteria bacterium]|nr:hypothetical protein [Alphaproteobacteria bacterium]